MTGQQRRRLLDVRRQAAHDLDDLQRQRGHQQDHAQRQQHQQGQVGQADGRQSRQPAFDQRAHHWLEDERHQPGQEEQQDDVLELLDDLPQQADQVEPGNSAAQNRQRPEPGIADHEQSAAGD